MDAKSTAKKASKTGSPKPEWPVEKATDLTINHIPQKLRDELERPMRAHARTLGRLALQAMSFRDDVVSGLDRAMREANKDGRSLNIMVNDSATVEALIVTGLAKPKEGPRDE